MYGVLSVRWCMNEKRNRRQPPASSKQCNTNRSRKMIKPTHTQRDESVENERKTTNEKLSELWMCINLTHFSRSYYTERWAMNVHKTTPKNQRSISFFLTSFTAWKKQRTSIFRNFFSISTVIGRRNQRGIFLLSLNFFSFASFQVHIVEEANDIQLISHNHRQIDFFFSSASMKVERTKNRNWLNLMRKPNFHVKIVIMALYHDRARAALFFSFIHAISMSLGIMGLQMNCWYGWRMKFVKEVKIQIKCRWILMKRLRFFSSPRAQPKFLRVVFRPKTHVLSTVPKEKNSLPLTKIKWPMSHGRFVVLNNYLDD